mmetsp:Transcript_82151/g.182557  ORF Transcript_82151/g.182557 Transcript_82151/m.182557 type:complete len:224 (+) Transcript_82151:126-797(+)
MRSVEGLCPRGTRRRDLVLVEQRVGRHRAWGHRRMHLWHQVPQLVLHYVFGRFVLAALGQLLVPTCFPQIPEEGATHDHSTAKEDEPDDDETCAGLGRANRFNVNGLGDHLLDPREVRREHHSLVASDQEASLAREISPEEGVLKGVHYREVVALRLHGPCCVLLIGQQLEADFVAGPSLQAAEGSSSSTESNGRGRWCVFTHIYCVGIAVRDLEGRDDGCSD